MEVVPADCPPQSQQDLLLLIHGTYASREADHGADWWQIGSDTSTELKRRLPPDVQLPKSGEVFHWSGENNERARIKAGAKLLGRLVELEDRGQKYHLIGHSHGGSIIWQALRMATLQRKKLDGLKSWSTVGTPFLHHRSRGAWCAINILKVLLAVALLKPALMTGLGLTRLIFAPFFGLDDGVTQSYAMPEKITFYHAPVLKVMDVLGVQVTQTKNGLKVGDLDVSSVSSSFEFLFGTREGWLVLIVALFVIYVFLHLVTVLIGPVLESLRIRIEERAERKTMETYRHRWLGLWSPDDEAINGLKATLDLSVSFVAQMMPRERVLWSDYFSLLSRPYMWIVGPVYNRFIRPVLDGIVRTRVIKTAQGNNRPTAEVIAVSPFPVETNCTKQCPSIPSWLNQRLIHGADSHARDLAPKLRTLLAEPSFVSGLESFGESISGRELVHTSYFIHSEVLDLLALNIAWSCDEQIQMNNRRTVNHALVSWFCSWKRGLGAQVDSATLVRSRPAKSA